MKIITFPPYGPFGEICCLLENNGSAALIDAPGNTDEIMAALSANGLKLDKILLTHGHFDHTGAAAAFFSTGGLSFFFFCSPGKPKPSGPYRSRTAAVCS